MYACPWCERTTFSFWQKQKLGPNTSIKCAGCKRRVSVPWTRTTAALPNSCSPLAGCGSWATHRARSIRLAGAFAGVVLGMMIMMPL